MIRFFLKIDWLLLLPALFLASLGLLMIYSTSFESDWQIFVRQAFYILFSVIIFFLVSRVDFRTVSHLYPVFYALVIALLVVTFAIGIEARGSTRWIDLRIVSLQGSELAKPILALSLAGFLAKYSPSKWRNFLISAALVALPSLLVFIQPDLGNSFILVSIWLSVVFIAGANLIYLAATAAASLASVPLFWSLLKDYQKTRLLSFLNPSLYSQGAGYNIVQALIALGSGQIFGRGLGRGTQSHLNFLPAVRTDFIFSSIGEELGFVGIFLVIVLAGFLVYRLVRVGSSLKSREASLFTLAAAAIIFFQFFINAGMNMGILPVTGVTLPFVSFGGSSIFSMFLLISLVQGAEREVEKN
jgi:rod shape determining protein RodA